MSRVFVLTFLLLGHNVVAQRSYSTVFPEEHKKALEFYHSNRPIIDSIATAFGVDPVFAFSIVGPEVGRYLQWRDAIETSVVEMFYVQMGSDYNDYSIGPFQMKAAFAEKVEEFIAAMNVGEDITNSFRYTEYPGLKTRQARINRLKTVEGSTQYLCGFILAFQSRLRLAGSQQQKNNVPLMAASYNYGFWNSLPDIEKHINSISFPQTGTDNFSYALVAALYYKQLAGYDITPSLK